MIIRRGLVQAKQRLEQTNQCQGIEKKQKTKSASGKKTIDEKKRVK